MPKKILLLYTAHTLGHKTIAENIAFHLEAAGAIVKLADALETERTGSVNRFLWVHTFVNKYLPFIWKWLYMWAYIPTMPLRTFVARFHAKKILSMIQEFSPDTIITTQTSPSAVISYLKSKELFTGKFGIAFSDFHFHPYWAYPGADFYLANIPEQVTELERRGVDRNKVLVCGLTLRPESVVSGTDVRRSLAMPDNAKVVLIGSGSMGIRFPESLRLLIEELKAKSVDGSSPVHIIVACGRNTELASNLRSYFSSNAQVHILGFYTPMEALYNIADVFVTKPGGLSVMEALRAGLPLFVTHILPGQEELNLDYLSTKGLVENLYVKPAFQWAEIILNELQTGNLRASLITNPNRVQLVSVSSGEKVKTLV